jgi:hypothetical protein
MSPELATKLEWECREVSSGVSSVGDIGFLGGSRGDIMIVIRCLTSYQLPSVSI